MAIASDDKLVANKKSRKNALPEDAAVSLRDQIPLKLADQLEELNIGVKVQKIWRDGNANRAEWLERQAAYLADWDEFLESSAEGPFNGSSNLHIPMPLIVAKTVHARFLQAVLGIEPYFSLKARREDGVERQELVSDVMNYALKDWCNYGSGVEKVVDEWLWAWVTKGSSVLKTRWDCLYQSYVDVVTEPYQTAIYSSGPDGAQVVTPVMASKEVEKRVTKRAWEGPVISHIDHEDLMIIGGDGDPQRADFVGDRSYLTASELWTLADRKIFRKDIVKEVILGGPDMKAGADGANIKQQMSMNAGKASLDTESDLDRYEVVEAYMKVDVEESGINSDIVVWVHLRSGKLLRATYLNRINKAGERPYFKIDFLRRKGQDYGIGLIEMLHPISKEMDAIHNMRVDFGMLATMPFGFYRSTSSLDPETIQLEPGVLIPVDDPSRDVFFPNLGNRTSFGFQEEMALQTMVERLTGINDMSLGVMTGAQGATRTATGARALLGESNANLDVHLRRLNLGWRDALQYLLHMLQQRIPNGLSFRVTGQTGSDYWAQVRDKEDIAGDFDFEVSSNSANSNKSIQQEVSSQTLQLVLNPLLIQMGVVSSGNIYEAVRDYLKNLGRKDFSKFCTKPPDYQHLLSPEDEANRLLNGIPVPVTPEMDHEGFIAYFEEIYNSDELLGQFNEQQTVQLAAQSKKHEAMLAALQQQQAQVANAQQMRTNQQVVPSQQSEPGQNPMAQSTPSPGAPI